MLEYTCAACRLVPTLQREHGGLASVGKKHIAAGGHDLEIDQYKCLLCGHKWFHWPEIGWLSEA